MKASDLFVKALENEGVKYIFGIPGEENLDMLESLRESGIEVVVTRHEQAAGFMAATVGRLTGKVGVCISTLGPGATNFTTPSAYALLGGMPMMMVTGQKPIKKSKQGQFQIIDVVGMMKPITKFAKQVTHGSTVGTLVREAVRIAEEEKPGPVHFEFPEDIAREEVDLELFKPVKVARARVGREEIVRLAGMIRQAKKPIFVLGAGCNRKEDVVGAMTKFIETTGFYFMNTQMGKGVIDERSERFLGSAALSANDSVHLAVAQADLIVVIGHDPIEKPPFIMMEGGPTVVHVNYYSAAMDRVYFPQEQFVGDIAGVFEDLAEELADFGFESEDFAKVRQIYLDYVAEGARDERFPMVPARVVSDMRGVMPSDGFVCLDNGMYKLWFARHYAAHERNTLILDNALASMGAGLPSAMAVKLLYPERKVVAVCGDGGFMMNSQELETAVRMGLDLVVVILNDNGYGMIKWKQEDMGFEDFGLSFGNPDFVKYAETYGAKGYRVSAVAEFGELLERCLNEKGVHVIEVPVDYSVNKELSGPALKLRMKN